MNLDKIFSWIVGVVIAFAALGKIDVLQAWIWRAQAKVVYASRTSTWGSPRFFPATGKFHSLTKKNSEANRTGRNRPARESNTDGKPALASFASLSSSSSFSEEKIEAKGLRPPINQPSK